MHILFDLETKFGMISHLLVGCISRASHPPSQGGWTPASKKPLDRLHARSQYMRNNSQILHGDQIRCEDNFHRVDHEC